MAKLLIFSLLESVELLIAEEVQKFPAKEPKQVPIDPLPEGGEAAVKAEQDVLPKEFVIRLLGADGLQEAVEAGLERVELVALALRLGRTKEGAKLSQALKIWA
jgi:hypothetical protein